MIENLIEFLNESPVNFLAVKTLKEILAGRGFREINAADSIGELKAGDQEIGRASVGKECVRRCRSRWSPYH